jgi:phage baseplate assembly protein W
MSNSLYTKITIPGVNNQITPQMYKGFSTNGTNTDNYKLYDYELIKQDILNHFHIRQGEKLMNPRFGTIIWDLLFEPLTEEVKNVILQNVNEIVNYDPRVVARDVIVTQYDNGLQLECVISYLPYNISEKLQLQFDQNLGLGIQ